MAYIVAWTEWPCGEDPTDHYVVFETERKAYDRFNMLCRSGQVVYCAAITKVMDATEPQWLDDVTDGPSEGESE